jgi:hypothetical protein
VYHDIYLDDLGKGYNLRVTVQLSHQDQSLLGVVGASVYLPSFLNLIETIKFRETGTVNMFHSTTHNVIASPKWEYDGEIPKIWDIYIDKDTTKFDSIRGELTKTANGGTIFTDR